VTAPKIQAPIYRKQTTERFGFKSDIEAMSQCEFNPNRCTTCSDCTRNSYYWSSSSACGIFSGRCYKFSDLPCSGSSKYYYAASVGSCLNSCFPSYQETKTCEELGWVPALVVPLIWLLNSVSVFVFVRKRRPWLNSLLYFYIAVFFGFFVWPCVIASRPPGNQTIVVETKLAKSNAAVDIKAQHLPSMAITFPNPFSTDSNPIPNPYGRLFSQVPPDHVPNPYGQPFHNPNARH
jgi:hypothetical protein